MSHVYYVTLLAALVLALLAPLSLAGAQPPPPLPARLLMDPPTQAELDAQAGLLPAGVAPLIRGAAFYDQDGDGSPESPQCDRGQRDLTVTLYQDAGVIGVYEPGLDTLVGTTVTDIIGNYLFEALPAPANYLVLLDLADPDLPAGAVATTANPLAVALAAGQSKTANLGVRVRETAAVRDVVLSEIAWAGTSAPTFAALAGLRAGDVQRRMDRAAQHHRPHHRPDGLDPDRRRRHAQHRPARPHPAPRLLPPGTHRRRQRAGGHGRPDLHRRAGQTPAKT